MPSLRGRAYELVHWRSPSRQPVDLLVCSLKPASRCCFHLVQVHRRLERARSAVAGGQMKYVINRPVDRLCQSCSCRSVSLLLPTLLWHRSKLKTKARATPRTVLDGLCYRTTRASCSRRDGPGQTRQV